MKLELIITRDGSHTLYRSDLDEHYHSKYGAVQESMHIYINEGLKQVLKPELRIFEVGFGTGLNALLSMVEAGKGNQVLQYDTIEKYPIDPELIRRLNYTDFIPPEYHKLFYKMHLSEWNKVKQIGNMFLTKIQGDIREYVFSSKYDLVYFDAFGPEKDPEIWSADIFGKLYQVLESGGFLITYSVKGDIRRRLQNIGFHVTRLKGPPGKKEILKAAK